MLGSGDFHFTYEIKECYDRAGRGGKAILGLVFVFPPLLGSVGAFFRVVFCMISEILGFFHATPYGF